MVARRFVRTFPKAPAPEFDSVAPAVMRAIDCLVNKVVEACCCDRREASQVVYHLAKERAGLAELNTPLVLQRVPIETHDRPRH